MAKITLNTTERVIPQIYAYTTPEIIRHNGWTKIGYTERDVDLRIWEQTHTADVKAEKQWQGNAVFDDGSGISFKDKQFHAYLRKKDVEQEQGTDNEWFKITGSASKLHFYEFRENHGILSSLTAIPYILRDEQADAVAKTKAYFETHENSEFLWNAKPRFGKTLAVYDLVKQINAKKVLVVTNRPAIANSWYSDYAQFMGDASGFKFVSSTDSLKNEKYVMSRDEYLDFVDDDFGCIEFVSLQDLKGSKYFSSEPYCTDKLEHIKDLSWDILVIDEAHEGVDTYKTDIAFNRITRKYTLHLSGTPFKALANDKFPQEAIFNWTYADEQTRKRDFDSSEGLNPYEDLPKLNLFTYQMSEIIKDEISGGIEIDGETEKYSFTLNDFFATDGNGAFTRSADVDKFLNALTTQEKFPFSTEELRNELKHTFWLLNRVDSAKALAKKLEAHPMFGEYKVILAAGDGKLDDADETQKSYNKVISAIKENDKTITLSVGQLTTGVTIPEWTGVLMLSSIQSPALYMQAAFRAQNPCLFVAEGEYLRKQNAYVFDFDPARTLENYERFANDLSPGTAAGKGDVSEHKENVRNLLNFFPVLGEDENGEMVALDAEKVLSLPRKIRSTEVVKRGFMCDFLFQNISNVFRAPKAVLDILENFTPIKEKKDTKIPVTSETKTELSLDDEGNVSLDDAFVIERSAEIFGQKIYEDVPNIVKSVIENFDPISSKEPHKEMSAIKDILSKKAIEPIITTAKEEYGTDLGLRESKKLETILEAKADKLVDNIIGNYAIEKNLLNDELKHELESCVKEEYTSYITEKYDEKQKSLADELKEAMSKSIDGFVAEAKQTAVKEVETHKKEQEKKSKEDSIKDRLRGFSRTIPSFLMAYGDEGVNLSDFDSIIPDEVFLEVTSITLDQFKFLRDGGDYIDEETGETEHFDGNIFNPIVFDDSIKEFLRLKKKLADYFDENSKEDIFDYIPPQKTNQIFTPKWVVKKMVDMLEAENPGCFDMPDKTFIDFYMKSGLYIAEIVKRLYRSETLKELCPDTTERLKHIFEKQVYGLAPTEIIYRIATNFILGFDENVNISSHNFRLLDALTYAKEGTLEAKLDEEYGE